MGRVSMAEPTVNETDTVSFGERLAASQHFSDLFREGMTLVEETASYLDTAQLCAKMRATGFRSVDDIGPEKIAARSLSPEYSPLLVLASKRRQTICRRPRPDACMTPDTPAARMPVGSRK